MEQIDDCSVRPAIADFQISRSAQPANGETRESRPTEQAC